MGVIKSVVRLMDRRGGARAWFALGALSLAYASGSVMGGCEREERIISTNSLLSGIPDAKTGVPAKVDASAAAQPVLRTADELVERKPDGTVTVRTPSIRDMMVVFYTCLDKEYDAVMRDYVLAQGTKLHFRTEGKDEGDALAFIKENKQDILELMGRMPAGERTPSIAFERMEKNVYRLRLTGRIPREWRFTQLWVALEGTDWKFYWVQ
jgi:hypothetical protein